MVKLYLIILKVFSAMLASIVVSPNDANLCLKGDISPGATYLRGLRKRFVDEYDGTNVPKDVARHYGDVRWDRLWVVLWIICRKLLAEPTAEFLS